MGPTVATSTASPPPTSPTPLLHRCPGDGPSALPGLDGWVRERGVEVGDDHKAEGERHGESDY